MTPPAPANRIDGKVALITGAARGIGEATAELFADAGARLVLADRDAEGADAVAARLRVRGVDAVGIALDVRREEQWQAGLQNLADRLGRLDILVNNAGTTRRGALHLMTLQDWQHVLSVNLDGSFLGMKHGIAAMRTNGGAIVSVGSVLGSVGMTGFAAYAASKGGLKALTKVAAVECAEQGFPIRVNLVSPGFAMTPMTVQMMRQVPSDRREEEYATLLQKHPLNRLASPQDVAHAILFLASADSSYMTGAEIMVDGGFSAA